MAKTRLQVDQSQNSEQFAFHKDVWSQKAQNRMSSAKNCRPVAFRSMSSEAAIAMQQLTNPNESKNPSTRPKLTKKRLASQKPLDGEQPRVREAEHVCSVKLSEVYEKLGLHTTKLEGDITDPSTWEEEKNQTKFVLGGGKLNNAMEIVEIVNADDPKPDPQSVACDTDEHVIEEIARINSINKCNVWFEAHESLLEPDESQVTEPSKKDSSPKSESDLKPKLH